MAEVVYQNAEFRYQRGTAARWAQVNPILGDGEPGYETDTRRSKVGDGFTAWNALEYTVGDPSPAGGGGSSDPRVGDLTDLTTEDKDTVVEAINEINMVLVEFDVLYTNAKAG